MKTLSTMTLVAVLAGAGLLVSSGTASAQSKSMMGNSKKSKVPAKAEA